MPPSIGTCLSTGCFKNMGFCQQGKTRIPLVKIQVSGFSREMGSSGCSLRGDHALGRSGVLPVEGEAVWPTHSFHTCLPRQSLQETK